MSRREGQRERKEGGTGKVQITVASYYSERLIIMLLFCCVSALSLHPTESTDSAAVVWRLKWMHPLNLLHNRYYLLVMYGHTDV